MNFEQASKNLMERQAFVKTDGLGRVLACLGRLGNPHEKPAAVHVTGTNGKGSVCALFDSVFRAAGYRTGLFISPHLISLTERIKLDGADISEKDFAVLFSETLKAGPDLNFFELLTCMAFLHFARAGVDIAVVEAGIGGRFDSTNVLPSPELSVLTSVDLDHQKYLGETVEAVAGQKAGIIKKGGVCLAPLLPAGARGPILREAQEKGAQARFLAPVFEAVGFDWDRGLTRLRHKKTGEELELGLMGGIQAANASLVWEGAALLNGTGRFKISKAGLADGFARVRWPGRFQILSSGGTVYILDGAHNPEAMRAFDASFAASPFAEKETVFISGMLADKDRAAMLKTLAGRAARIIFTRPPSPRAVDPCALADEFSRLRPDAEIEVQENIEAALASGARTGTAAVIGSFYLVGAALKLLGADKPEKIAALRGKL